MPGRRLMYELMLRCCTAAMLQIAACGKNRNCGTRRRLLWWWHWNAARYQFAALHDRVR